MKIHPTNYSILKLALQELNNIVPSGRLAWDEPMSKHTSFCIGGPADVLVSPVSEGELRDLLIFCKEKKLPYYIIGKGTNLLVRDKGIRGIVIKTDKLFSYVELEDNRVKAGAGLDLGELSRKVADKGLSGLEFAVDIPGSLGGAIVMNAGAYGGEMKDVVLQVRVLNEKGEFQALSAEQLDFGYRYSTLQECSSIVVDAVLELTPGDTEAIYALMNDFTKRRKSRQPLDLPSAGSTFRRPEGHYVGPMIEKLGLKGFRVNDAQVSELHAGFIVNRGKATAADVLKLIRIIQDKVRENYGVELIPEYKIIGEE